jgi:5'-nucleotidase
MWNRRSFLKQAGAGTVLSAAGMFPFSSDAAVSRERLTILHTNDVHSHLEPFPEDHPKYPGMGGVVARKALIDQIRQTESNVLLLDSGDIFQGTPYFNFFNGEPEIRAMNEMGYDAATIGNHEFDAGPENLAERLFQADFPFVCSNYFFHNTVLNNKTRPFIILKKGKIKIGLIGLGVELKGLVPDKLCKGIGYRNPVEVANKLSKHLKEVEKCHLVIALSHLGFSYSDTKVSDLVLAEKSGYLDIILGGHTHTFMDAPVYVQNIFGQPVLIHQTGWAGLRLGRIDLNFEKSLNKKSVSTQTVIVDKKSIAF